MGGDEVGVCTDGMRKGGKRGETHEDGAVRDAAVATRWRGQPAVPAGGGEEGGRNGVRNGVSAMWRRAWREDHRVGHHLPTASMARPGVQSCRKRSGSTFNINVQHQLIMTINASCAHRRTGSARRLSGYIFGPLCRLPAAGSVCQSPHSSVYIPRRTTRQVDDLVRRGNAGQCPNDASKLVGKRMRGSK